MKQCDKDDLLSLISTIFIIVTGAFPTGYILIAIRNHAVLPESIWALVLIPTGLLLLLTEIATAKRS